MVYRLKITSNNRHCGSLLNVDFRWNNEYEWWEIYDIYGKRIGILTGHIYGPLDDENYELVLCSPYE